jgi:hypothetical protein
MRSSLLASVNVTEYQTTTSHSSLDLTKGNIRSTYIGQMRRRKLRRELHSIYGLDDRGVRVRVPVGSRIFSSPCRPCRALGLTQTPIYLVPRIPSPRSKNGRGVKLTTHLQLVSSSGTRRSDYPICLHGVVLN